ncbi:MAG: hypothetical protein H7836_11780 [Magnetococcus sp. YQC-3]
MFSLVTLAAVGMIQTAQPVGRMIDGVYCNTCTRTVEEAIKKPRHITSDGVVEPPERAPRVGRHGQHGQYGYRNRSDTGVWK